MTLEVAKEFVSSGINYLLSYVVHNPSVGNWLLHSLGKECIATIRVHWQERGKKREVLVSRRGRDQLVFRKEDWQWACLSTQKWVVKWYGNWVSQVVGLLTGSGHHASIHTRALWRWKGELMKRFEAIDCSQGKCKAPSARMEARKSVGKWFQTKEKKSWSQSEPPEWRRARLGGRFKKAKWAKQRLKWQTSADDNHWHVYYSRMQWRWQWDEPEWS